MLSFSLLKPFHQMSNKSNKDKEGAQEKPKAFTIKYKRPRGSRACVVCRSRKVRCDAEIHIPCTNCITFGCDCELPASNKRGNGSVEAKNKRMKVKAESEGKVKSEPVSSLTPEDHDNSNSNTSNTSNTGNNNNNTKSQSPSETIKKDASPVAGGVPSGIKYGSNTSEPVLNISQISIPPSLSSQYKYRPSLHKNVMNNRHKHSLTFLGASSAVGLVAQNIGENHVQLNEDVFEGGENSLDSIELEILKLRGAFLLPANDLALDLINTYFEHIHPLMPVLNRTEFMNKFTDPNDNPPLMLLQSVLLCGCRISRNPLLLDSRGSNNLACLTFFRRAKALYETNYESDPVAIVQTLILIGTYWDGPEDVTKNSFYWTRVGVSLAQGFGFHRDISKTPLSSSEKKTWKRIWWCLFEKDRNVAVAFGRPPIIDLNDCDVPMLTLDDFDENDPELGIKALYPVNEKQALYFIHLVKLSEITGIIIRHQYTVKAESMKRKNKFSIIQHCDMLMGIWFTNVPEQLQFSLTDESKQDFFCCLLNAQYYNRLYLIHRSNLIRMARSNSTDPNNYKYPSWGISFQAARMISIISKILLDKNQIIYCPLVFIYIVASALLMLIYHIDSTNNLIASTASDSLIILRAVLKELAKYYPIAGVLVRLFDKYTDDKIKRAKVIERGSRIAMNQEMNSAKRAMDTQNNLQAYYGSHNRQQSPLQYEAGVPQTDGEPSLKETISPTHLMASGISPRNESHDPMTNTDPTKSDFETMVRELKAPIDTEVSQDNDGANVNPINFGDTSGLKQGPSPNSSTSTFPDISLVTESMPTHNFFENFDPSQLFPDTRESHPPTRAQSPLRPQSPAISSILNHDYDPSIPSNIPQTPGALNTNFIDNSFINMNLQSGVDNMIFEDLGSFLDNVKQQ